MGHPVFTQPVGSASLQPVGSGTHTPPPQSAVHPHVPVAASHAHPEGKQPRFELHVCPAGQPLPTQPLGSGPLHVPPAGTQTPPPQSSVQTQDPLAASHEHDDGVHPCEVSQVASAGHPFTMQPAGLAPSHALGAQLQTWQPSGPVANPFSQYRSHVTGSHPPGGGLHAQISQPSGPVWKPCSHASPHVSGWQPEAPDSNVV